MKVTISKDKKELGVRAGVHGGQLIQEAIHKNGSANIILATGASQFEMLNNLVKAPVDWDKVTAFHLDEYIAMPESHPASFRRYLRERVLDLVPIGTFYPINAEIDPESEVDVAEAITPFPMTKVRVEEYYSRWKDKITLMGCIPECLLLKETAKDEELDQFMDGLFKNLKPGERLILGVADSIPPHADFGRLERIGERIEKQGMLPL